MESGTYLFKMVFSIHIEQYRGAAQFDEQFRMIRAENEELAVLKAQKLGKDLEDTFQNSEGNWVNWRFEGCQLIHTLHLTAMDELIFSQTREMENPEGYLAWVRNPIKNPSITLPVNQPA